MPDDANQLALPLDEAPAAATDTAAPARRTRMGRSTVAYVEAKGILTEASGFIAAYDYTLNPYSGCTFGCSYCYAAFFVRDRAARDDWGRWVEVKQNALDLLRRRRRKPLRDATIYLSSVTDPYQPIERELGLTRTLLEELLAHHQVRLVVQTRSPLVVRDLDLLRQFPAVRVNMTVTTDDEAVRKAFEPTCASIDARLRAITTVQVAGVPTCITMTPLLPVADPAAFAQRLLATGVRHFVAQFFHAERGQFVGGTRAAAMALCRERGWSEAAYRRTLAVLRDVLPDVAEGKDGFAPV
jgi:DNA repair photolyase